MTSSENTQRIVGIDLGTTHTVVAWSELDARAETHLFEVPQLIGPGEVQPRRLLPSNLYAPLEQEQTADLWNDAPWVVGEYARRRTGEAPSRSVSSAKSWLCHPMVDRTADILPWHVVGADQDDETTDDSSPRVSPVSASARLLSHVRRAWDQAFPDFALAEQEVVLTVPASFDAVARQLTVKAAEEAGLKVRLLEEPQAAFYDFMRRGGDKALEQTLPPGADSSTVLVCDVGGGTTDLSLIRIARREPDGELAEPFEVERVSVGRHLLLGGDNMDLALAHLCEQRLVKKKGERLSPRRFAQLAAACRQAKEQLLGEVPTDKVPITLLKSGAKLIGGAMKTELSREDLHRAVLEAFFPPVKMSAKMAVKRSGIVAFGLPYERDVAITRHLAAFLSRQMDRAKPNALLLNGGVFRSQLLAERLAEIVSGWVSEADPATNSNGQEGEELIELPLADPDVQVALGAVAYGLALRGLTTRIGGGSARSYYVGLQQADRAVGSAAKGACVLPQGAQEGAAHRTADRRFSLTLGRPVRFELFASDSGHLDREGELVDLDPQKHERLPPLVATLPASEQGVTDQVNVMLEAQLSAIGTLDLACVQADVETEPRRFELAFDLRASDPAAPSSEAPTSPAGSQPAAEGSDPKPSKRTTAPTDARHGYGKRYDEASGAISRVFGKGRKDVHPREVKGLVRTLEKILGARPTWSAALARGLYDVLWPLHRARRRSADHERMFWSLAGFCLRPGAGDPLDPSRATAMAKLFEQRLSFPRDIRNWQQFWIAWRRIAAGLSEERQAAIRKVLDPFLAPEEKRLKKPKAFRNDALADMLDLAACLERLPPARRSALGSWILERTWTDRDPRLWAALGRIGARVPTYGSVHQVVPVRTVQRWMDHLLREDWDDVPTAPRAAVMMCRVTDDRARDLPEKTKQEVLRRLAQLEVPDSYHRAVSEYVAPTEEDRAAFYGEDLPVGLRLVEE